MEKNEQDSCTTINNKRFNCDKCGECCKHIDQVPLLNDYDIGNGRCKYLTDDNLCSIYDQRPNVCRGTYMYRNYFSHMSVDEFYKMTEDLCNKLKNHEKLY